MESKNELKCDIKNRVCYYCDDIIKDADVSFSNVFLDKKLYENVSVDGISIQNYNRSKTIAY